MSVPNAVCFSPALFSTLFSVQHENGERAKNEKYFMAAMKAKAGLVLLWNN